MAVKKKQAQLSLEGAPDEPGVSPQLDGEQPSAAGELSFEDAIQRLQEIVEQLESEGQPLDESLKLFEEGVRLARHSQARLETAEKKVQELLAFDESGRPIVEELDPD